MILVIKDGICCCIQFCSNRDRKTGFKLIPFYSIHYINTEQDSDKTIIYCFILPFRNILQSFADNSGTKRGWVEVGEKWIDCSQIYHAHWMVSGLTSSCLLNRLDVLNSCFSLLSKSSSCTPLFLVAISHIIKKTTFL